MIYTADQTAAIFTAIESVMLGNNGYANIGTDALVADAVRAAGFTVILSRDLFGNPVYKGFTSAGHAAAISEAPKMVSRIDMNRRAFAPDYEGAILDRQERMMMDA